MPIIHDVDSGIVVVEKPTQAPGCCIASLKDEDYEGFVDTGNNPTFVDPHVYVSVSWIKQVARVLGMEDGDQIEELRGQIEELEGKLIEAERAIQAVDTLKSSGFVAEIRKGRPQKTATERAKEKK